MPGVGEILLRPFLPRDVRLRLRHQRIDGEASKRTGYILATPDLAVTLVKAVDGREPGRGMRLVPKPPNGWRATRYGTTEWGQWYTFGAVEWDGRHITVIDARRSVGGWRPTPGGLRPGFDAVEIFRAGARPAGSGECLDRVAAVVTVGLAGRHLQRILLLDEEARELLSIPARGFVEADLVRFAEAAGICYRSYAFTLAKFASLRASPSALCEALFPRSARRAKLAISEFEFGVVDDWFSRPDGIPGY